MLHLDFPLSGDVQQGWNLLFRHISPQAGRGLLEQKIFTETASYGTQLGLLTDVLINMMEQCEASGDIKNSKSFTDLVDIHQKIKNRIDKDRDEQKEKLIDCLKDWIKRTDASANAKAKAKAEKDALQQALSDCF